MKLTEKWQFGNVVPVAPRAGAWIETRVLSKELVKLLGRPPRGGVD